MTGPIHGMHRRPQIALRPPEEPGTDGRLALETFTSVEEPRRRAPRPRLGESGRWSAMASIARRPDGTYRPRYRDEHGKEHARHFKRKVDAQRWLDEVTDAMDAACAGARPVAPPRG